MDIKTLLAGMFDAEGNFSIDGFIAVIKSLVKAILGFVAKEEGYDFPAAE